MNKFSLYIRLITQDQNHYIVIYQQILQELLTELEWVLREDGNEIRREITLHSFRRFCKSTISDLGYSDYSEWYIGHSGSTYWRKKDSEKAELFKKIEPYLTFLDIQQLERKGSDMQTKIVEFQEVNQILRNREQIREERDRKSSERLSKLEAKFDEWVAAQDKAKKIRS